MAKAETMFTPWYAYGCSGKTGFVKNSSSESYQIKFAAKLLLK